ncbi:MAG: hypothetical protein ABI210_01450 [Abditibacteriaceae bacterium]
MAIAAIVTGALLILSGVGFYVGFSPHHFTALIPAVLGIVILVLGFLARNEKMRRHAMHGAMVFGLIGFLGSLMGIPSWINMVLGKPAFRPQAAQAQFLMFVICGVFLVMCVRSFMQARREQAE